MKINESRLYHKPGGNQPSTESAYTFDYRVRLLPTQRQVEFISELIDEKTERAVAILAAESGDTVNSAFDSAAESGFLTTRLMGEFDRLEGSSGESGHEDSRRKEALNRAYEKFREGDWDLFEIFVPIHCTGVPFLVLRCQLKYSDRYRALHFYTDVVPALASQLRQLVHDAMLDDLDQKLRSALRNDVSKVVMSVQTAFPMPGWQIKSDGGSEIISNQPLYWNYDFVRGDPQQRTLQEDLNEVLAKFNLAKDDRYLPAYVIEAKNRAFGAIEARLKSTNYKPNNEQLILYENVIIQGGEIKPRLYRGKPREILIAIIYLRLLQQCYFPEKGQKGHSLLQAWLLPNWSGHGVTANANTVPNSFNAYAERQVPESQGFPQTRNWPGWRDIQQLKSKNIELTRHEEEEVRFWLREAVKHISKNDREWKRLLADLGIRSQVAEVTEEMISNAIAPFVTRVADGLHETI